MVEYYFKLAHEGELPADFKDWSLEDDRGLTVALVHELFEDTW